MTLRERPGPPLYRLTLSQHALVLLYPHLRSVKRLGIVGTITRPDGRVDVPISFGLLDQLKTAALPKEDLSDTVVRVIAKQVKP